MCNAREKASESNSVERVGSRNGLTNSTGKSCYCYKLQALVDKEEKNRVSDTQKENEKERIRIGLSVMRSFGHSGEEEQCTCSTSGTENREPRDRRDKKV